jgi:hypothetical protein
MLFGKILRDVSGRGLLRDEQFGLWYKHSTALQLARLFGRVTRDNGKKRLTGAVFPDEVKAFDTVWVDSVLYSLTVLNFPSHLTKTNSSYLHDWTFEASFQTASVDQFARPLQYVRQGHACAVTTSSFPPARTTRLSLPHTASQRCSSATWNHISAT